MGNTYIFSEEEIQLLDLFQTYFPKIMKRIKQSPNVVNETEPSLNPMMVKINDKDLEVIDSLMKGKGFDFTSNVLMIHFLLMNPINKFDNEEKLVDYLSEKGGLGVHQISDILIGYNRIKDRFSNGGVVGEIPTDYLENRKYGIREYDGKGNKVLKWSGVHNGKMM